MPCNPLLSNPGEGSRSSKGRQRRQLPEVFFVVAGHDTDVSAEERDGATFFHLVRQEGPLVPAVPANVVAPDLVLIFAAQGVDVVAPICGESAAFLDLLREVRRWQDSPYSSGCRGSLTLIKSADVTLAATA